MIQKIKCWFGFHKWSKGYFSQASTYDQNCLSCYAHASDGDIYD